MLLWLLTSSVLMVISSFSSLLLLVWTFSLFLWVKLARGLSVLLIFFNWFFFIFLSVIFVSISLILELCLFVLATVLRCYFFFFLKDVGVSLGDQNEISSVL